MTARVSWTEWTDAIDPAGRQRSHLRLSLGFGGPQQLQAMAGIGHQWSRRIRDCPAGAVERRKNLHASQDISQTQFQNPSIRFLSNASGAAERDSHRAG